MTYRLAADLVLALHTAFVLFVVLGLVLILLGGGTGWRWVRNPWLRLGHLLAIGVVAAQAWLGAICPLTILEMRLRARAGQTTYRGSFLAHWMESLLYYEAPAWVFALAYTAFGLLVVLAWVVVRPRPIFPFPALETERLRLRAPRRADVTGFAELLSDPSTHPFLTERGPLPRSAVRLRIAAFLVGFRLGRSVHWVLETRTGGEMAGFVAIHGLRRDPPHLSYAVRRKFRRQGLAREALQAVCESPAVPAGRELVARTHRRNEASRGLLLSLGFEEAGLVRTHAGERVEYRRTAPRS